MYSNHRKKKSISLLLALVMVLSMFISVMPQTAVAENVIEQQTNNDAKAAAEVDRLISRFGAKEAVSEAYIIKVQAARTAYDALTEEAKALVIASNVKKLIAAEAKIEDEKPSEPQIKVSNDKISMTEAREIEIEVTFAYTPNLEELEWTLGNKSFDQWKKWVNEERDFVGEPWISFLEEPTVEGNTVKATIKTDLTFNTVNLSGRPYPRTAYPQLVGFYDLKVTDSKTTLTKELKINAYDNYHTWEEMKPAIDKMIETSESKSDRYFEYRSIGKSTEGRDMHFVIIAKDKDAIDKYLNTTKVESLNNPKDMIQKIDNNQMNDYQVPIFVNNVHPDEAPAVDAQLSFMELFANQDEITFDKDKDTEVTLKVDEVLEDLILVFNLTQNPDGRAYNTRQNIDGFDLNRDNAHQVMKETKNITRTITEWNPLVFLDLHGFVKEFLIEPCTPPHEPNFEYDLLMGGPRNPETGDVDGKPGAIENARAMGDAGIANTKYDGYIIPLFDYQDGWDDATTAYTGVYSLIHGALGHTVEVPELNQDSNDAAVYAMLGTTNYVLENKDELYKNQLKINLRGIENEDNRDVDTWHIDKNGQQVGRKRGDNENYFPEYYILPLDENLQKNKLEVYNTIEYLLRNGARVEKSTEEVVFNGVTYPAGSIIVPMRQAKRGLANSILSQGSDESDWDAMYAELVINFPAMKGYDKVVVREKGLFDNKTSQVKELNIPNTAINEISEKYVIKNNNNDAVKAVNELLNKGKDVDIITGDSSDYNKGDFVVSKENMNQIKNDYLLRVSSLEGNVKTKPLVVPKIASTALASQTRFVLEQLGFDIVEDKDSNIIVDSAGRADKEAVESGKPYVGIGTSASNFVRSELLAGLEVRTTGRTHEGLLNGQYSQDNIITESYDKDDFIYIAGGTVITKVPSTTEVLAKISDEDDFYIEGWWPGNTAAKGQIYGINDRSNDRNITLFTGDLTNKAHPQHLYRLLSSSIYSSLLEDTDPDIDVDAAAEVDRLISRFRAAETNISEDYISKVKAAREAYDALTDETKELVIASNVKKLNAAETKIKDAKDKEVAVKVDKLISRFRAEETDISEDYISKVKAAREAYDALTDDQKGLVIASNVKKLNAAETKIKDAKDKEAAAEVDKLISRFRAEETDISEDYISKVRAAREAYNALTDDQKELVSANNIKKLNEAETKIKYAEDKVAASKVDRLILRFRSSERNISPKYIAKVQEAREAYDALTDDQKQLVKSYNVKKLNTAEAKIKYAENKWAALKVDRLILRFGYKEPVSEKYIAKVKAAREAYDALTDDQKQLVKSYNVRKLNAAENRI